MEFGKEKEYIELRQGFNKETKSMAMLNKVGYIKWLEHKLVKNLALAGVGCSFCEEIPKDSFYLGMSCEECNTPFRVVKNK